MSAAVIEIGSRAIRLLVAARADTGIRVLESRVVDSPLNAKGHSDSDAQKVEALARTLESLRAMAARHEPQRVIVFGTASLRGMDDERLDQLRSLVPGIVVLSALDEAKACHASACLVARLSAQSCEFLVSGDIGSGSFELTGGSSQSPGDSQWYVATEFGSNALRELVLRQGLVAVARELNATLTVKVIPKLPAGSLVSFSGSAPTKFAWLRHKVQSGEFDARYDGAKVQGKVIDARELRSFLEQLEAARREHRGNAARIVSPEDPGGPELEILLGGMKAMVTVLSQLGQARFMVNAYGARHGVASLIFGGRIQQLSSFLSAASGAVG